MINHHSALIYTMLLVSASDRRMTDNELSKIGNMVKTLPIFVDYDPNELGSVLITLAATHLR
jgi:hypothetical protein